MSTEIVPAQAADVEACIAVLERAFDGDPLMRFFFQERARPPQSAVATFFTLLMKARLDLGAPVLMAKVDGRVAGAVMGYGVARPPWPAECERKWNTWVDSQSVLAARFEAYDAVTDRHKPREPHHYLGVIGVDPANRGLGIGRGLLNAFGALAEADSASHGVYLETANLDSLAFYKRNGFVLCGEGSLDGVPLWCVYRAVR